MIISKEQIDVIDPNTNLPTKELIISYVNKQGGISFFKYVIPPDQMFKWVYTNRAHADQPFQVFDYFTMQPVIDPSTGQQRIAQWKSYDDKWVKRVPVKELPDSRTNEILDYWGNAMDPLFEMNIPETWYCDIETDVTDDGFPTAEDAASMINTISLTRWPKTIIFARKPLSEEDQKWVQGKIDAYSEECAMDPTKKNITKGYKFEYRAYNSEREMLEAFIDFITPIPALTGWNFLGYDWMYIHNRCKNLNIDLLRCAPTHKTTTFKLNRKVKINLPVPLHKVIYDYLIVYQLWDQVVQVKENNTLDFVAGTVLKLRKVDHTNVGFAEFYRDYYKEYVFYNCIDTILVEQIDKTLKTADVWYMLACELRIELNTAFSTIRPTETVMCNYIYPRYRVMPEKKMDNGDSDEDYEGAFVWPTQPGIYKHIGGLDFASLYPSIMRQFQISPESFLFKDLDYEPKEDEIKTCSGAVYKKDPNAIVPAILTDFFAKRKAAKMDKKIANQEMEVLKHILEERRSKAGISV